MANYRQFYKATITEEWTLGDDKFTNGREFFVSHTSPNVTVVTEELSVELNAQKVRQERESSDLRLEDFSIDVKSLGRGRAL